jgi:hypothetical protein
MNCIYSVFRKRTELVEKNMVNNMYAERSYGSRKSYYDKRHRSNFGNDDQSSRMESLSTIKRAVPSLGLEESKRNPKGYCLSQFTYETGTEGIHRSSATTSCTTPAHEGPKRYPVASASFLYSLHSLAGKTPKH